MPFGFQNNNIEINMPDNNWKSSPRMFELPEPRFLQSKPISVDLVKISNFNLNPDNFKSGYSPTTLNGLNIQPPKLNINFPQINFPK